MSSQPIKLRDLNATFIGAGGEGIYRRDESGNLIPAPKRSGVGIMMDCPCGCEDKLGVFFKAPLDGGPPVYPTEKVWNNTGDTIDTLTLSPSVRRIGGCAWHGWIRDGSAVSV